MTIRTLLARTCITLATLAALLLSALFVNAAYAAETTASAATAAIDPVVESVLGAIGVVVGGYAVRLIHRGLRYLGLAEDARVRAYLEDATLAAVDYAMRRVGARAVAAGSELEQTLVSVAANYLERRVPDALSRFGLAGTDLADYVTARLPRNHANG
ncbi:hypothetical protein P7L75_09400 [Tistrella mobilis]|uniref:hypothetical protein n=1 Tax=Tistrella mobilis TaxID=171437 RepID=UPI0035572F4E